MSVLRRLWPVLVFVVPPLIWLAVVAAGGDGAGVSDTAGFTAEAAPAAATAAEAASATGHAHDHEHGVDPLSAVLLLSNAIAVLVVFVLLIVRPARRGAPDPERG